jgi:hypothetical protein
MGVLHTIWSCDFSISKDKYNAICATLMAIKDGDSSKSSFGKAVEESAYSSCSDIESILKTNNLVAVFNLLGVRVYVNAEGAISGVGYQEKMTRCIEILFKTVAPFIGNGHVAWNAEGEGDYRFVYEGGIMTRQNLQWVPEAKAETSMETACLSPEMLECASKEHEEDMNRATKRARVD